MLFRSPQAERLFTKLCDTYRDMKDIEIHWISRRSCDEIQSILEGLGVDIYHPKYLEFRDEYQYAEVLSNTAFKSRFC